MTETIHLTPKQIDKVGHWLSECLDDAAPLREHVWRGRAEWMVAGPTFQEVVSELIAEAVRDAAANCPPTTRFHDGTKWNYSITEYLNDLANQYAPNGESK